MKKYVPILLAAGWLGTVSAGVLYLAAYDYTPGRASEAPKQWPVGSDLVLAPDRPTLILFAHPNCPCTRASIGELAVLMAQAQGRVNASVVFFKPGEGEGDWQSSGLWQSAAAIPGVSVRADHAGKEALQFHATTSGHTVLFASNGDLLFSGGITSARGHSGDNDGRSDIVKLLRHETVAKAQTPVFGCSLFNPAPAPGATKTASVP